MKPPLTIGDRTLARLVQVYTNIIDEIEAGRTDKVAALKREATGILESSLHRMAGKLRQTTSDRNQLAAHLDSVRRNTLQAVVDTVTLQRPELAQLLHNVTDPPHHRA